MAKTIMEEAKAGKETADAVIVAVPPLLQFGGLNVLASVKQKESAAYPKAVREPHGYWFPIVSIGMIQIYNPKLVKKSELPKTAMDLTDPKWRDAIVTHDLTVGTLGAYWLASLRPIFGEKKWQKFTEGLAKNRPKAYPLYDPVVDSVTSGETKLGLTVLLHDFIKAKRAKRDIKRLKLKDVPMLMTFNAIARTRAGRHPAVRPAHGRLPSLEGGPEEGGGTYLRIPARTGTGAPYSFEEDGAQREVHPVPQREGWPSSADSISIPRKAIRKVVAPPPLGPPPIKLGGWMPGLPLD